MGAEHREERLERSRRRRWRRLARVDRLVAVEPERRDPPQAQDGREDDAIATSAAATARDGEPPGSSRGSGGARAAAWAGRRAAVPGASGSRPGGRRPGRYGTGLTRPPPFRERLEHRRDDGLRRPAPARSAASTPSTARGAWHQSIVSLRSERRRRRRASASRDDRPLDLLEVAAVAAVQEAARSPGTAGSRRRPRSCAAGSRAPRPRVSRRSPTPPRWMIDQRRRACASGAIFTSGTSRSTWYFGGGTTKLHDGVDRRGGKSALGDQQREAPARARVQPALDDSADPLAPREQRRAAPRCTVCRLIVSGFG